MAEVIWTDGALDQLNDIAEYVALDNVRAAEKLIGAVMASAEQLSTFPLAGKCPVELDNSIYRELTIPPCRLFYRLNENKVFIVHVMRQEQQLKRYLLSEPSAPAYY